MIDNHGPCPTCGLTKPRAKAGRPRTLDPQIEALIIASRDDGESLREIANRLNRDKVPTPAGARQWYPASIGAIDRRARGGSPRYRWGVYGKGMAAETVIFKARNEAEAREFAAENGLRVAVASDGRSWSEAA